MSKSRTTSDSSDSLLGPCTLHRKQSRGFQPYASVIKKKKPFQLFLASWECCFVLSVSTEFSCLLMGFSHVRKLENWRRNQHACSWMGNFPQSELWCTLLMIWILEFRLSISYFQHCVDTNLCLQWTYVHPTAKGKSSVICVWILAEVCVISWAWPLEACTYCGV